MISLVRKLQVYALTHPNLGKLHDKARHSTKSLPRGYRRIVGK